MSGIRRTAKPDRSKAALPVIDLLTSTLIGNLPLLLHQGRSTNRYEAIKAGEVNQVKASVTVRWPYDR